MLRKGNRVRHLLITFVIVFAVFEVSIRTTLHVLYGVPGKTYGIWQNDDELGADHRTNAYNTYTSTNNMGFRNREDVVMPKPKNAIQVVAIGGSTTFGYNLQDDETFTHKLQTQLRTIEGYEGSQVLNGGRVAFSAAHNLILLKRMLPELDADYVLIYEGVNELLNAWAIEKAGVSTASFGKTYGHIGKTMDKSSWLTQNLYVWRLFDHVKIKLMTALQKQKAKGAPTVARTEDPWARENFKVVLGEMIDYVKAMGATPIVIHYASVGHEDHSYFSDLAAEVARNKDALVYDMRSDFEMSGIPLKDLFIYTGVHMTAKGADIVAEGLGDLIVMDQNLKRNKV